MWITFDSVKNAKSLAGRNLSFERVGDLDWETAVALEDSRYDYGERRFRVLGLLDQRLHVAIVTYRADAVHVISFRKANQREVKFYDAETR